MTYSKIKLDQKLTYLRRLLNIRVALMKFMDRVEVVVVDDMVSITWYTKEGKKWNRYFDFEVIEFPVAHLSKRIEHYKRKVRTEFKNRNK